MKYKYYKVFVIIQLFFLLGCAPKHVVTGPHNTIDEPGFYYALPKTVVRVELPVHYSSHTCGIYENLSDWDTLKNSIAVAIGALPGDTTNYTRILKPPPKWGQCDPKNNGVKTYRLGAPTLSFSVEADASHIYRLDQTKSRQSYTVSRDSKGVVKSLESVTEDRVTPALTAALSALPFGTPAVIGTGLISAVSREEMQAQLSPQQRLANLIGQMRQARWELLTAGQSFSGDAVKHQLEVLQNQESELLKYFLGSDESDSGTIRAIYRPNSPDKLPSPLVYTQNLASVDASLGVVAIFPDNNLEILLDTPKNLSSVSPIPDSQPANLCPSLGECVNIHIEPRDDVSAFKKSGKFALPENAGFRYRLPVDAYITVNKRTTNGNTEELIRDVRVYAQLGEVVALPSKTGNAGGKYTVTFDSSTGFVTNIIVTGSKRETDVADALVKAAQKREEEKDELAKLQKEKSILEARKAIRDLKIDLGE